MKTATIASLPLCIALMCMASHAQDTRKVSEPVIPPACVVLNATLHAMNGELREEDESKLDTQRIQQALDHCEAGKSVVLRGDASHEAFLSGPLELRENVALVVERGVTLYASRDPKLYDIEPGGCGVSGPEVRGCKPLLSVKNAKNVAVMGDGAIDGRGGSQVMGKPYTWWQQSRAAQPKDLRYSAPRLIVASHADGLVLYRIHLHNSPNFHVTVAQTDGFTAWGVHILTPTVRGTDARNTDGIDPSTSQNILVTKSWINDGDDNIAIKASVHRMSVIDNHFYSGHGMSIGSEARDEADILVDTLTMDHTTTGIRIKSNVQKGGDVRGVTYRNICMRDVPAPISISPFYTGKSRDDLNGNGMKGTMYPDYKGILLQNVVSTTPGDVQIAGINADHVTELTLDGVVVRGVKPEQIKARYTKVSVGPMGTNLSFSGEGVEMLGKPVAYKSTASCENVFLPYRE
ncbi:glycoside hydrolase family 28 protein [Granulicella cerasi]|uniref:Glycoside hydrolase family 28 protein n=1 Tax=Granulicella cerasi TaxID=741063 RepID=A0ABW1ZFJ7_9BACT|nr:glycoside hydrolase family 28 protein [Granulicella cerasi]